MAVKKTSTKTIARKKTAVSKNKQSVCEHTPKSTLDRGLEKVTFKYVSTSAREIYLVGTFNDWNPSTTPLKKDKNGIWTVTVDLDSGCYEYKFVVDGDWYNDPECTRCVPNPMGTLNCVIEIK